MAQPRCAPARASLLRALVLPAFLLLALAAAPAAGAVTQTVADPTDGYADMTVQSTDYRSVTWDTTTTPGKALLSVELDFGVSRPFGGAVFLDTSGDGKADWAIDITSASSVHPDFTGSGGEVDWYLRRVRTSTDTCQSYDDWDNGYVNPYWGYNKLLASLRTADARTTFTIPLDLATIGDPASFRWALAGASSPYNGWYYDFVPDATNGLPDRDPHAGTLGEADDWYCSPAGDGLSAGYRVDLSKGALLAVRDTPPPAPNQAPTVDIVQDPERARPGQPVSFTANATDTDGTIVDYAWDFDDDGDPYDNGDFADATGRTVSRTFAPGTYRVGVRVKDDDGASTFAYRTVEVAERPPALTLTATNTQPLKSEKLTVTAVPESDTPVADASIEWGFDSDNNGDDAEPYTFNKGRTWTLGFGAPGTYTIKARFTTAGGQTATARIQIVVPNQPPTFREFRIRAKQTPDNPYNQDPLVRGKPIILQALLYDDNMTRPRVEWDLDGDGTYDDAVGEQIEQTYQDAGEKKIGVRIVDEGGLTAFGNSTFEVRESAEATCNGKAGDGLLRATGCFQPDPKDKGIKVTKEPMKLNGLDLIPKNGAQINVQAVGGLVFLTGGGTVQIKAGTVVLFDGRFAMDPNCKPAEQECLLGRFSVPALSNLKGLPLKGDVDVYLTPKGTRVKVNVDVLGSIGLGVTARADLITTDKGGLQLDSLEVRSPMIPLGKLTIGQFYVTFDGKTRMWTGGGEVTLPTPQFTKLIGDFAFSELTGFQRAHGEVDGLNLPLDEGTVYLQRIAFTLEVKGFEPGGAPRVRLGGGIGISAGPRVAGVDIATVDGDFLFTFGNPVGIDVEGRISIAGFDIMGGTVSARTNGDMAAEGFIAFGLPFPSAYKGKRTDATKLKVSRISSNGADVFNPLTQLVSVKGEASAWVEPDAFDLEASIFAKVIGINLAGAEGLLSSKGVAGCGEIVGIRGGFGYDYASQKTDLFGKSCDLGPYRPVRTHAPLDTNGSGRLPTRRAAHTAAPRAVADPVPGATALDVPAGEKALFLRLDGTGGDPVVTLVAPDGTPYEMPDGDATVQRDDFFAARHPQEDATFVAVRAPQAGQWQLVPHAGSAPIAAVSGAPILPRPKVRATVRGTGATRTIDYAVTPLAGQEVSFVEQGKDTHRTVGVAKGASGSITFTPQEGSDRTREVVAIVTQGDYDRAHLRVARFTAPALRRVARPVALRARRSGSGSRATATIAWDRVPGVSRYQVVAHVAGGRTLFFPTRATHLRVPSVARGSAVRFDVRAVETLAKTSPWSRLRLGARVSAAPKAQRAPSFTG